MDIIELKTPEGKMCILVSKIVGYGTCKEGSGLFNNSETIRSVIYTTTESFYVITEVDEITRLLNA